MWGTQMKLQEINEMKVKYVWKEKRRKLLKFSTETSEEKQSQSSLLKMQAAKLPEPIGLHTWVRLTLTHKACLNDRPQLQFCKSIVSKHIQSLLNNCSLSFHSYLLNSLRILFLRTAVVDQYKIFWNIKKNIRHRMLLITFLIEDLSHFCKRAHVIVAPCSCASSAFQHFLKDHLASRSQIQSLQYPKVSNLVSSLRKISQKVLGSYGKRWVLSFYSFSYLNTHTESIYPWHSQGSKSICTPCKVEHTGISVALCTSSSCLSEKHSCICCPAAKMRHLLNHYPDLAHVLF